ncbi:MAG: hypothetical protein ABI673_07800 [Novosphingobium sp.]
MDWTGLPASVIGGIIGAFAGGLPAWLLAKRQSDEALRRDRETRTAAEKVLAFKINVKLLTIINNTIHDWCHFHRSLALLKEPATQHMEPWQAVRPIIGHTDADILHFDAEELAIFMAAKERQFLSDLIVLAQRHATSIMVMREYCSQREALKARSPHPENMDGDIAQAMITDEERMKLLPYTRPLNGMVVQMVAAADENIRLGREVAGRIRSIFQAYFGDDAAGGPSFPTDSELEALLADSSSD